MKRLLVILALGAALLAACSPSASTTPGASIESLAPSMSSSAPPAESASPSLLPSESASPSSS